jgi:hypothetical protein
MLFCVVTCKEECGRGQRVQCKCFSESNVGRKGNGFKLINIDLFKSKIFCCLVLFVGRLVNVVVR